MLSYLKSIIQENGIKNLIKKYLLPNHIKDLKIIIEKINQQKTKTIRGSYALEVYEQVAKLALFSYETFIAISNFDKGKNDLSLVC